MRHEKTVSVSKIKPLWEPWEEDETPRKNKVISILMYFQICCFPTHESAQCWGVFISRSPYEIETNYRTIQYTLHT